MEETQNTPTVRKPKRAAVLGGGAFGTAIAQLLARQGAKVLMYMREEQACKRMNETHENSTYLPDVKLSENIIATTDVQAALTGCDIIMCVIPTPFFRKFVVDNYKHFPVNVPIIVCSKGIEKGTHDTPYEMLRDELPGKYSNYLGCLSGPSFAKELALGLPTSVTVASPNKAVAALTQEYLSDKTFRVYTSTDVIGCEYAGALKNVLAIACGASEGAGLGYGSRAALITRGLAEMGRFLEKKGGDLRTLTSLAGVGDLTLTCTATMSRNYTVGVRLAKGETMEQIKASTNSVAEGVFTALSIHEMRQKTGIDMPLCEAVYKIIYEGVSFDQALRDLQARPLTREW